VAINFFFAVSGDAGVRRRQVLNVGLVQRRMHRADRSFQSRRPGGQVGGVELQCVRH